MTIVNRLKKSIIDSISVKESLLNDTVLLDKIEDVSKILIRSFQNGNKVIFAGNGGSAADAQHLAAEFVSRLEFDRPGLPAISLSTDTSMITAIANDYGYDNLFSRQLQAQANSGDIFIGITTSGKSSNILRAFDVCKGIGVTSIALCGLGGNLDEIVDHCLRIPSSHTPRIQESHILVGHMICSEVEITIFGHLADKKHE